MKELTEEKAKAYDKAIEKLRNAFYDNNSRMCEEYRNAVIRIIEPIFPELKESWDEKVRKWLISTLKSLNSTAVQIDGAYEMMLPAIAWLEKQGKQKLNVGDWVIYKGDICQIVKREEGCNKLVTNFGIEKELVNERNLSTARLWTIQDAKEGDVLFSDLMFGKTFIYNRVNPDKEILYSFIISNAGEDVLPYNIGKPNTGIGNIEENKDIIHPATKEQRDLLFQKMKEAGYEWDVEKKALKKIEQNQVSIQNERDEANLNKAPEKIYLTSDEKNSYVFTQKRSDNIGVEYARIDSFIEKACKYFRTKKKCIFECIGENVYHSLLNEKEIEDFKKYMQN